MASISTGQGEGGKKALDHEIPLIPFIDLLLCCVMFLLVTAVWNQLASVEANLDGPGNVRDMTDPSPHVPLSVRVLADGYLVASGLGDETRIPRSEETSYDLLALREHLAARRQVAPNEDAVVVSADDGVAYADIVQTMDVLTGSGFPNVTVSGTL